MLHAASAGPRSRRHNFKEVALGLDLEGALHDEAERCLCRVQEALPVRAGPMLLWESGTSPASSPPFRIAISKRSYQILKSTNALPAVCGRVCPQESQCECTCVVGTKLKPVAIGRLERFVADIAMGRGWEEISEPPVVAQKTAAIIGSGPRGWPAPAKNWRRQRREWSRFPARRCIVAGGVLKYGIPEFRLPDIIIDAEIENLKKMGVEIRLDSIIGKLFTIPQLLTEKGFNTAFVGTGA